MEMKMKIINFRVNNSNLNKLQIILINNQNVNFNLTIIHICNQEL